MNDPLLQARRARVAARWSLSQGTVVIGAGAPIPIPGSGDQFFPFLPHPEYRYLSGSDYPGAVIAFHGKEGWRHFAPEVAQEQRVWEGVTEAAAEPLSALAPWLAKHAGEPLAQLGCTPEGVRGQEELSARLREELKEVRRAKDSVEVALLRRAAAATAHGYERAREVVRPGASEREIQIEIEAAFFRGGGDRTGYASIVGSGPNAAILHSTPSQRRVGKSDVVLIDAGAEVGGYCADVTRTFVVTPEQRDLHAVVLEAEQNGLSKCRPGKAYREIHLEACLDLARGLVHHGILKGDPQTLVERDAHALFFPHGIGHLVGLGVRDGDSAPARKATARATLRYLRLELPLQPGYVVTIEPGLYFIPAILDDPGLRERHAAEVDWKRADGLRALGGIRIEDNALVTEEEPEILTAAIPF